MSNLQKVFVSYHHERDESYGRSRKYSSRTIPPRLHDNIEAGFASIHEWSEDPNEVQGWIHQAYCGRVACS